MNFLFTALAIGIFGSFHCIGMCGPIALALPFHHTSGGTRLISSLLYNAGRITTYSLLGAFFGFVGQGFYLAAGQQIISIALGITVILLMLLPRIVIRKINPASRVAQFIGKVKQKMRHYFTLRSFKATFLIGSLNGLLPCGLVYLGIAGAIATGNPLHGMLYMLLMGAGTLPIMLLVSFFGNWISIGVRNKMKSAIPVFIWVMGFLLILRGLSLDIPYLSPAISNHAQSTEVSICH